jgi:hypothetical protein
MKRFVFFIVTSFLLLQAGNAAGTTIITVEEASCGTWTSERAANSMTAAQLKAWSMGFLSGWALTQSPTDPLRGMDKDKLIGWIDNYCRAHPLDQVTKAVAALIHILAIPKPAN